MVSYGRKRQETVYNTPQCPICYASSSRSSQQHIAAPSHRMPHSCRFILRPLYAPISSPSRHHILAFICRLVLYISSWRTSYPLLSIYPLVISRVSAARCGILLLATAATPRRSHAAPAISCGRWWRKEGEGGRREGGRRRRRWGGTIMAIIDKH